MNTEGVTIITRFDVRTPEGDIIQSGHRSSTRAIGMAREIHLAKHAPVVVVSIQTIANVRRERVLVRFD